MSPLRPALALAVVVAASSCATYDLYRYDPVLLPEGSDPQQALHRALGELRAATVRVQRRPLPPEHLRLAAVAHGLEARLAGASVAAPRLFIRYDEFPGCVRAVTERDGGWTVWLADRTIELELRFQSFTAARLFLDAATTLGEAERGRRRGAPAATG